MPGAETPDGLVGSALELAKPVVETGCRLVESLLGKPCKVAGDMLADQIYVWQWRNRIRIASRAKEILDEKGIAEKVLPPGFFLTLLDKAGYAEDPTLQEMWANLLVSAVDNEACRRSAYVATLSQLSRDEALLLLRCERAIRITKTGESQIVKPLRGQFITITGIKDPAEQRRVVERWSVNAYGLTQESGISESEMEFCRSHVPALGLARVGPTRFYRAILQPEAPPPDDVSFKFLDENAFSRSKRFDAPHDGGAVAYFTYDEFALTRFGRLFLEACGALSARRMISPAKPSPSR